MKLIKYIFIFIVMFLCVSCKNKNEISYEDNLNLKGTKWKLELISYAESNIFRVLEPVDCEECYTLIFDTNTTAKGFVVDTPVGLIISGKKAKAIPPDIGGEGVRDAKYYMDAFFGVNNTSYSISETEMKLHFSEPISINGMGDNKFNSFDSYLLYKKIK